MAVDSKVIERYLLLGLRLGRHIDGLVDAYYGPAELSRRVADEPLPAASELAREAAGLRRELKRDTSPRARWLDGQVDGLAAVAERLEGRPVSYTEEVRRCYGVEPEIVDEDELVAAREELDAILPGNGAVRERYQKWQSALELPPDRILTALERLNTELRARTRDLFGLPDSESVEIETVSNQPWAGFNYYLGRLRSRVVINTDVPTRSRFLVLAAAHEAYPGHHTEHAWKETMLIRERGQLEESIQMIGTSQCLVTEGIATNALSALGPETEVRCEAMMREMGFGYDIALGQAIEKAAEPNSRLATTAAWMVHEQGRDIEEVKAFALQWSLEPEHRVLKHFEFLMHPVWRAYNVTYVAGERLIKEWSRGDSKRFERLLKEQLTPSDLAS